MRVKTRSANQFPIYIYLLFDGIAVGFFLYLITFNTPGSDWFFKLALPIIVLITILVEILAMLLHALPISFISTGLYIFVEIAVFCIGLELLIEHYIGSPKHLVWSAVVLTVCGVISILLATIICFLVDNFSLYFFNSSFIVLKSSTGTLSSEPDTSIT